MPKLLQIDSCLGVLSTGRISEGIAKVALAHDWECYIAHGARYVGNTIQNPYQIESRNGEYIHYINSLLFDAHGLGSTRATKALLNHIEDIHPDVFQLHCIHGYYLNYKILFDYLSKTDIPVVWTQHDCWGFTGHCAHFITADCEKWKNGGCYECPLRSTYPKSLIDRSSKNYNLKKRLFTSIKNMTIVSVSNWLDSVVNDSFLNIYPHIVIYNGIDTNIFQPCDELIKEKYGIITPHYLLAVSAAWDADKGLEDYKELSKIIPEDFSIVLVGVDETTRKNLPAGIVAIPRTDSKHELAKLYSNADYVLSLSYGETMGLTIVEGLSCGTPAIVYDNTAQPEIVPCEVGHVIETGCYSKINEIIQISRTLSTDEIKKRQLSCRKRAVELFGASERYQDYLNLYNSLI